MHVNLFHATVQMAFLELKVFIFGQSYSPVACADSFRINISIADMHRLTARIFYVSNTLHNTTVPIHEIVCVITPPYYIYCFEKYYPNVPLNWDEGPFCLQHTNIIQGKKTAVQKWNQLLDVVVTILKYKKITIDHDIYIKVFSEETVTYLRVSTDDFLNTNNNETSFSEIIRVFEEAFEIKFQEGYVLKYLNFQIWPSPLGFSVY